jgi:hypothetical protein
VDVAGKEDGIGQEAEEDGDEHGGEASKAEGEDSGRYSLLGKIPGEKSAPDVEGEAAAGVSSNVEGEQTALRLHSMASVAEDNERAGGASVARGERRSSRHTLMRGATSSSSASSMASLVETAQKYVDYSGKPPSPSQEAEATIREMTAASSKVPRSWHANGKYRLSPGGVNVSTLFGALDQIGGILKGKDLGDEGRGNLAGITGQGLDAARSKWRQAVVERSKQIGQERMTCRATAATVIQAAIRCLFVHNPYINHLAEWRRSRAIVAIFNCKMWLKRLIRRKRREKETAARLLRELAERERLARASEEAAEAERLRLLQEEQERLRLEREAAAAAAAAAEQERLRLLAEAAQANVQEAEMAAEAALEQIPDTQGPTPLEKIGDKFKRKARKVRRRVDKEPPPVPQVPEPEQEENAARELRALQKEQDAALFAALLAEARSAGNAHAQNPGKPTQPWRAADRALEQLWGNMCEVELESKGVGLGAGFEWRVFPSQLSSGIGGRTGGGGEVLGAAASAEYCAVELHPR